jgi:hypothetical protein
VEFGLGKYHNRNVMDGFGGVSRGAGQWTVRASRRLAPDLERTSVGPVQYQIVEPLKKVRFVLARNTTQSICFDVLFEAQLPPFFEKRNRLLFGNRVAMNVVRYHQPGSLSGWVQVDGERYVIDHEWFAYRDHSWGMRGRGVGEHPPDLEPHSTVARNMRLLWGVFCMRQPDGTPYELAHFLYSTDHWQYFSGHLNRTGEHGTTQQEVRQMTPEISFDPRTRQFRGGTYHMLMDTGESRRVHVSPLGSTGFYLRTGLYGGWNGARHGSWLGEYHESGEYIADVRAQLAQIGQLRDVPVCVEDAEGRGYGIQESVYSGVFPQLGLGADSDFANDF